MGYKRGAKAQYRKVRVHVPLRVGIPYIVSVPKNAGVEEIKEVLREKNPADWDQENMPEIYSVLGSNYGTFVNEVNGGDIDDLPISKRQFKRELIKVLGDSHEARELTGDVLSLLYEEYDNYVDVNGGTFEDWVKEMKRRDLAPFS